MNNIFEPVGVVEWTAGQAETAKAFNSAILQSKPEFSVQKFREILEARLNGKDTKAGMASHPPVYWNFYVDSSSPIANIFEPDILAMSDEEILGAYARWRIES